MKPSTRTTIVADSLIGRLNALSLEQKVRLLTGADFWALYAEPAAGLRRIVTSDGPAGVRGETWDERRASANVPSPTALGATWDVATVERVGRLLAGECRRKGVDVLLAPTVNLQRSPYGGRHFEVLSEDPLLTSRLGAEYVRGLQRQGVAACVKHFVANDSETERYTADMQVDERTLRELYLAPFEHIVREAGVWAVMAAYNKTNGATMSESRMLREILHDEWGFDGVTMTDWFAGRSTDAAANAGLDLMMPGPESPWGDALVTAVRRGRVSAEAVDDKVLRLLRLAERVGALTGSAPVESATWSDAEIPGELRTVAAKGFVLLRNERRPHYGAGADRPVLPMSARHLTSVAVIGPNARSGRALGGGSAMVFPPYTVSPLDGLRAGLGPEVEVHYAAGVRAHTRMPPADIGTLLLPFSDGHGIEIRFLDADGATLASEHRLAAAYNWHGTFGDFDARRLSRVQARTRLRADEAGIYVIGGSGVGRFILDLDEKQVFDVVLTLPDGADPVEALMRAPQHGFAVDLAAGQVVDIVLTHEPPTSKVSFDSSMLAMQLNVEPPSLEDEEGIAQAVALAAAADAVVVVVGTNEEVESEGFDRESLALPGAQDELVRRVAGANPRTVVVVNSGAPVLMPWRNDVAAVLLTWFPGQEFGNALADVLLGSVEPGGRLPTTWPADERAPLPSTRPVDGAVVYTEGLHIGYRRFLRERVEPAYWFGHGLGYTHWTFGNAAVTSDGAYGATVVVPVTNSGERSGREVVQVYLERSGSSIDRPVRWLAGFATVDVLPGEKVDVRVEVAARAFEHWDVETHSWALEPGPFQVHVARSAAAVVQTCTFDPGESAPDH